MASREHIRHPVEWGADQLKSTGEAVGRAGQSLRAPAGSKDAPLPAVVKIQLSDLKEVLTRGVGDFGAYRTDVMFLCIIYPLAGLVLVWAAFDYNLLPLVFPLAFGFALIGPVAAVGLYEMSRRREEGVDISWADAFGVMRAPAFGAIVALGLVLLAIFLVWLAAAYGVYAMTLGPEPPVSIGGFLGAVFTTGAGWAMIAIGMGIGALFAALVLMISVISFPMLLDRDVGLYVPVVTSINAVLTNPGPMVAWGLIVAAGLVIGSIPVLLGLVFVMPVLGHATWHLYRKVVPR